MDRERLKIPGYLKFSRLKVSLFFILFLFTALVPTLTTDYLPTGKVRMQPAALYLLFAIDSINEATGKKISIPILYTVVFASAYFLLYFLACALGEGILKAKSLFSKKDKDDHKKKGV